MTAPSAQPPFEEVIAYLDANLHPQAVSATNPLPNIDSVASGTPSAAPFEQVAAFLNSDGQPVAVSATNPLPTTSGGGGGNAIEPETGSSIKISAFPGSPLRMGAADSVTGIQAGANVNFSKTQLISGPDAAVSSGNPGYSNNFAAGNGDGAGAGGHFDISAGNGGLTASGGPVLLKGGNGGASSGAGGSIGLYAGSGYAAGQVGGSVSLYGGNGTYGGNIVMTGGRSLASNMGGKFLLYGGPGGPTGNGGAAYVRGGSGGGTSGSGGTAFVAGGSGAAGAGGSTSISSGIGAVGFSSGNIYIEARPTPDTTQPHGFLRLATPAGGATNNQAGGDIEIVLGAGHGSGRGGVILTSGIPTSAAGLPTGAIYSLSGVLKLAP